MRVLVIDYGMGNLGSVQAAVKTLNYSAEIRSKPDNNSYDKVILPGVGNFNAAVIALKNNGWIDYISEAVKVKNKPILGICLGMQLLASTGEEGEQVAGLNLIGGNVKHLKNIGCKKTIPHVGWNSTKISRESVIFKGIKSENDFYYLHSYCFSPRRRENVVATVFHDKEIVAAIEQEHIFGTQFHPEKSSRIGLKVLENFLRF